MRNLCRLKLSVILFFLGIGINDAVACPCFNNAFLELTFENSYVLKCIIYKNITKDYIYKAEISDVKYIASSTHTECFINTAHHDVYRDFSRMDLSIQNIEDHHECIDAIVTACKNLHITLERKQY